MGPAIFIGSETFAWTEDVNVVIFFCSLFCITCLRLSKYFSLARRHAGLELLAHQLF